MKINHPKTASEQRPSESIVGWLENVTQDPDGGVRADLHVLKSHEMAGPLFEAAERNPGLYTLSHNADGKGHYDASGEFVVEELVTVRSVDLVDEGATNKTLFEGVIEPAKKIKVRDLFESLSINLKLPRRVRAKLLEMGEYPEDAAPPPELDAEMPEPAADADPMAALKEGFMSAASAVVDQALSGSMDPKDALAKLKELIVAHTKLNGSGGSSGGSEEPPAEDTTEDKDEDDMGDKKVKESKEPDVKEPQVTEQFCKQAMQSAGIESRPLLESLLTQSTQAGVFKTILAWKDLQSKATTSHNPQANGRPAPRSQAAGSQTKAVFEGKVPETRDELKRALLN